MMSHRTMIHQVSCCPETTMINLQMAVTILRVTMVIHLLKATGGNHHLSILMITRCQMLLMTILETGHNHHQVAIHIIQLILDHNNLLMIQGAMGIHSGHRSLRLRLQRLLRYLRLTKALHQTYFKTWTKMSKLRMKSKDLLRHLQRLRRLRHNP